MITSYQETHYSLFLLFSEIMCKKKYQDFYITQQIYWNFGDLIDSHYHKYLYLGTVYEILTVASIHFELESLMLFGIIENYWNWLNTMNNSEPISYQWQALAKFNKRPS